MLESLIALLIGASLSSLVGSCYWTERQRADRRPRRVNEAETHCVWCLYRRGDFCAHPGSPVYPGECRPVCAGRMECEVQVVKQWGNRA